MIPLSEAHLRSILREWIDSLQSWASAQCVGSWRAGSADGMDAAIPKSESRHRLAAGALVLAKSVLGGLHHEYFDCDGERERVIVRREDWAERRPSDYLRSTISAVASSGDEAAGIAHCHHVLQPAAPVTAQPCEPQAPRAARTSSARRKVRSIEIRLTENPRTRLLAATKTAAPEITVKEEERCARCDPSRLPCFLQAPAFRRWRRSRSRICPATRR